MRKILNPYVQYPQYNCFGCSPNNENGLKMEFFEDGDEVVSTVQPKDFLQGYFDILHGGIQSTMLDEIANWVVHVKLKTAGVTSKMEVRFLKPAILKNGPFMLRASLIDVKRKLANIKTELYDSKNVLCAKADVQYFIYPEDVAKEKLKFPGAHLLFED